VVASQQPDIILLKLDPAGSLSQPIIQELLKTSSRSRIILLARSDETQDLMQAVLQGVLGIVSKTESPEVLINAIQKVHAGEAWIEHSLLASLLSGLQHNPTLAAPDPDTEHIAQLNPHERKVIHLIGQGLKNRQIAEQLHLSERRSGVP
jgi:DNA-binding NarL/FixJ family response regulator